MVKHIAFLRQLSVAEDLGFYKVLKDHHGETYCISEATLSCRGSGVLLRIILKYIAFLRQLSVAEDLGFYRASF